MGYMEVFLKKIQGIYLRNRIIRVYFICIKSLVGGSYQDRRDTGIVLNKL